MPGRNARHHADPVQHDPAPGDGLAGRAAGRRRTDRGGRRIGLRGPSRGRGSPGLGRKREGPARERDHHPEPLAGPRELRTGLPGGGNRGRSRHVLARLANGQVYAWGADNAGQLGFAAGGEPWERCGEGAACSTIPSRSSRSTTWSRSRRPKTPASCSRNGRRDQGGLLVRLHRPHELFGLGNVPYEDATTPTPITSLGPVRSLSLSSTTAVVLLEHSPGPPRCSTPRPSAGPRRHLERALRAYKLRYRPAGTREFSSPKKPTATRPAKSAHGTATRTLRSHAQDPRRQGRTGKDPPRAEHAAAGARCPRQHLPAHAQRRARDRNGQTRRRPDADGRTRQWTNHPTGFTYAWLRCSGLGENGVSEEEGTECEPITSGPRKRPSPPHLQTQARPTSPGRSRSRCGRPTPTASVSRAPNRNSCSSGAKNPNRRPAVHHPADAVRRRRRRSPADRPPWQLGKRTPQLRREVVPLQRPQPRRHRRHLQGDHAQEPRRRANPNRRPATPT